MPSEPTPTPFPQASGCACERPAPQRDAAPSAPFAPSTQALSRAWNRRYAVTAVAAFILWLAAYSAIIPASQWLAYTLLGLAPHSHLGDSVEFFVYDSAKILLLLVLLVYVLAWLRAGLHVERVRDYLMGKARGLGYLLGAGFGAVTPFCSCSSIPLFLGFSSARIPVGITMAFLITSPLVNEVAVVLLWGLLGWKFTLVYVTVGILAGMLGGLFMDSIRAERWLQSFIRDALQDAPPLETGQEAGHEAPQSAAAPLTLRQRHDFAYSETTMIAKRVWLWVLIGVGLGAALHGYVPQEWFAANLGAGEWWSVPVAVAVGIPLYSNVTGIIPIMESLLLKGLPIGTTLAFCMSTVAASLPEILMLKQVMQWQLLAAFLGFLLVVFTLVGWLFNALGPFIMM